MVIWVAYYVPLHAIIWLLSSKIALRDCTGSFCQPVGYNLTLHQYYTPSSDILWLQILTFWRSTVNETWTLDCYWGTVSAITKSSGACDTKIGQEAKVKAYMSVAMQEYAFFWQLRHCDHYEAHLGYQLWLLREQYWLWV